MDTSLEAFLLLMAGCGVRTPYQLKTSASLSVGSTLPGLRMLEKAGLLRRGVEGVRKKQEFRLTVLGRRRLRQLRKQFKEDDSLSLLTPGAVARVACVLIESGDTKSAIGVLRRSAEAMSRETMRIVVRSESDAPDLLHQWMATVLEKYRKEGECRALRILAERLKGHAMQAKGKSNRLKKPIT